MTSPTQAILNFFNRRPVRPQKTEGAPGTPVFGGFIMENEKSSELTREERYRTFSEILTNVSIVGLGTRYFLNLCAKASWTFEPADDSDEAKIFADLTEEMLTEDPSTSWARIVRRSAMYRFYGFSIQEWTATRRPDGLLTFSDIAPRPQSTIDRWDVATDGAVLGVEQCNPQNQTRLYIPRGKMLYIVDDTLSDSPEGLGLFRHCVPPARRLERYEQLEGFGFETDLRGVPIGRVPYTELNDMVERGEISAAQAANLANPVETFVEKHIRKPDLGLIVDSAVFQTTDDAQRPSAQRQYDVELLKGSQTSLTDMARAIERLNREIARLLGIEAILLGEGDSGSFSLSRDKTQQFSLQVDGTLQEQADAVKRDLINVLFDLNGWPKDMMPEPVPEPVNHKDVEQVAAALRDMASAGATITAKDPVVNDVRNMLGVKRLSKEEAQETIDANKQQPAAGSRPGGQGAGEAALRSSGRQKGET